LYEVYVASEDVDHLAQIVCLLAQSPQN